MSTRIMITRQALEVVVDQTGLSREDAEFTLQMAISACKFPDADLNQTLMAHADRLAEALAMAHGLLMEYAGDAELGPELSQFSGALAAHRAMKGNEA